METLLQGIILHRSKASDPGCFGLPQRLGNADLVRSRGDLCDAFLQARYSLAALADIFDGGEKRRSTAVKGAENFNVRAAFLE